MVVSFPRSSILSTTRHLHHLSYRLKQQFLAHARRAFDSEANNAEQERIAELERMVGKLTMELELAKKATSIAHSLSNRNGW
jgi:hypothetical protein